jgi:hypothetical protein
MTKQSTYSLSFTAASLRLNELITIARTAKDHGITDLKKVKEIGVVFNSVKNRTNDREFREIRKRLELLTKDQIEILINGDLVSQKQVAFLAVCKHYLIIRDFTIEVIREKVLVYDYKINESDFTTFIKNKINTHPELEEFNDSTLKKGKQVLFHILEQADIINNTVDKSTQLQLLQSNLIKAIAEDDPNWLKIFMMSDMDIKSLKY